MKRILVLLFPITFLIQCTHSNNSIPQTSFGTIDRIENFSSNFFAPRTIDIWLPDQYTPNKKYAVLYMHDGQMLYDATKTWNKQEWGVDEVMEELMNQKKIEDCIVVGIWNNSKTRHSDYFPQKPFEYLLKSYRDSLLHKVQRDHETNLFSINVRSDDYLKFLVQELKPYIDQHYSTKKEKENTFIMGSSMGGLISMYAICEYPEIFSGAACLSTHWVGTFTDKNNPIPHQFITYLDNNLPNPDTHKLYFDYGTETLDALYEPFQLQVDSIMRKHHFTNKNWKTSKFEGHDHSENAWKSRLDQPLLFLLSND
ncbi:hypothetical protein UJ101_02454 [Flavobacteriaceae bacterium UJ101]|nr:hypothetical protein UJ101_02454 [Flavobacteriaceae bacterium UJ101]